VPGHAVLRSEHHSEPDLEHNRLPDAVSASLSMLVKRLEAVENTMHTHAFEQAYADSGGSYKAHGEFDELQTILDDSWHDEDFII
jgi:hypothetical protein